MSGPVEAGKGTHELIFAEYDNSSVGEEEHFELRQLWETLTDWRVIVCALINASVITPGMSAFAIRTFTHAEKSFSVWYHPILAVSL